MSDAGIVFVVDDDAAVRDSLAELFRTAKLPVETFASAEAFLRGFDVSRIGCLVLDLKMPGMSGIDLQQELSRRGAQLPIIFLSARATVETSVRAMKGGAIHFLLKPFDPARLVDLVRDAIDTTLALQQGWSSLSEREREVLAMLAFGTGTKAIADKLSISTRTVEGHRANLMGKLNVHTMIELANLAHRFDLAAYAPKRRENT